MEYLIGTIIGAIVTICVIAWFLIEPSDISKRGGQPRTDPLPYPPPSTPLPGCPSKRQPIEPDPDLIYVGQRGGLT